ncbi:Flagellar motor rotation protein MotB [hydrothermal vent metagenome]|uniref:Flagellar motor rotation protein MotB n=1 Tax=hydrothermal vent metagenome TaxID=652676 RepID=A0A3B1BXN2_9ZZZZ
MNEKTNNNISTNTAAQEAVGKQSPVLVIAGSSFNHEQMFDNPAHYDPSDESLGDHWSVPWADLMMVMFVLFASLLTVQLTQEQQRIESLPPEPLEIEKAIDSPAMPLPSFEPLMRINVFEQSQQAVRDARLENVEIVLLADQSVKVSVQGPMFFELGKADLFPEVRDFLERLAIIIRQTPYRINVIGHTDDYPISTEPFPSNWELSLIRASRVARFLLQQGQIDPARFTVMGRSKYQPAVPNDSVNARAQNRRVEIIITRDIPVGEHAETRGNLP